MASPCRGAPQTSPSLRDTSPTSGEARSGRNISDLERKWELFWGVMGEERIPFSLSV